MNQDKILTSDQNQPESSVWQTKNNPDLEQLADSIIRDLHAPLQSLTMFTELLIGEYQSLLDEQSQQYLDRIAASSLRMQNLIEDLSFYSGAATSQQTWITIDLNQTVARVQSDLQSEIAQTGAKITVGKLPQLILNPIEIYQLFKQLLDNAIEFSDSPPQIEISATARGEEWLFAIADRGIGIAPEFHQQIFEVFKRLHGDAHPGSGMGLAICQKIVQRYGGTVWVESQLGAGSTFYFTLPIDINPQAPDAKIVS